MGYGYKVYFTERPKNRVICWDPDSGEAKVVAGEPKDGDPKQKLRDPYGLAIDTEGNLLIADKLNHRICRLKGATLQIIEYDSDTKERAPLRNPRKVKGIPMCPTGIFVEGPNSVLCAFSDDHCLYRIHKDKRFELVLGVPPSRDPVYDALVEQASLKELERLAISGPTALVKASDGVMYFIERGYQIVRAFDPKKGLRCVFPWKMRSRLSGIKGAPATGTVADYHPKFPSGLALDGKGFLYVSDVRHGCVMAVDLKSGELRRVVQIEKGPEDKGGPAAVAFGPDGAAWVVETHSQTVRSFKQTNSGAWKPGDAILREVNGKPLAFHAAGAGIVCGQ